MTVWATVDDKYGVMDLYSSKEVAEKHLSQDCPTSGIVLEMEVWDS